MNEKAPEKASPLLALTRRLVGDMTKARQPLSVEDAVFQVIGILGIDESSAIAGVSPRELRFWSDPDSERRPIPLPWAINLDRACIAAGAAPPLWRAYRYLLSQRAGVLATGQTPAGALTLVMGEVGDVARAIAAAMAPDSCGGEALSTAEQAGLLREIDDVRRALAVLEAAVMGRSVKG